MLRGGSQDISWKVFIPLSRFGGAFRIRRYDDVAIFVGKVLIRPRDDGSPIPAITMKHHDQAV